jgi:hypothetical protein
MYFLPMSLAIAKKLKKITLVELPPVLVLCTDPAKFTRVID